MGILTNPRHELFAQELAKGKSASEGWPVIDLVVKTRRERRIAFPIATGDTEPLP